ncbi:beta-lactamase/transpeptidase-like protein [Emericellopsis atlantica]|uniref:Beta-lactamase/transpeptidase-like protein n=1 Tax=Emericellopsis atlantica TaxID=2614577 RepID=A0A9P7ZQD7_9HYPO|nr:beta-lactamase/transpeptidase-like protein [Emericellopsis atlantica]KAG9255785.1 beta-lactamase/transpeptidase-like protein [Emericellopsis atlantica]
MPSLSSLVTTAVAVSSLCAPAVAASKPCPPLGAVLPAPKTLSKHDAVKKATAGLTEAFDELAGAKLSASAVSIGVKSLHESKPLFEYHFTPPVIGDYGTDTIDADTIYRVGSISKMMPALAALQSSKIDMDESVLKYVPELKNATGEGLATTQWEDISVRSLASHLAGLATDLALDLAAFPNPAWQQLGLPSVVNGTGPTCSGLMGTRPCTAEDLIKGLARSHPISEPYASSPSYSNVGFAVLGMVVEAATGQSFNDYVQDNIFDVAGMDRTSFDGFIPDLEDDVFVPPSDPTWNRTLGVFEAAGGMFSSTNDLLAFAEAIQNHELLSAIKTRQWMKPETHTSSLGTSVGGPWEILRSDNITADGRLIDVYTKSGDLGFYHALMGIVPDYDLSVVVIAAGPEVSADPYTRSKVFSLVLQGLLPAAEAAGIDEADRFHGTYRDENNNATLVVTADDGPGLLIEEFYVRGFDVKNNIGLYSLGANDGGSSSEEAPSVVGRLYPTTRTTSSHDGNETAWRGAFDAQTDEVKQALADSLFWIDGQCQEWFGADRAMYNYLGLSDFAMVEDAEGEVLAIKNAAFNVTMTKVSGEGGKLMDDASVLLYQSITTQQTC